MGEDKPGGRKGRGILDRECFEATCDKESMVTGKSLGVAVEWDEWEVAVRVNR